VTRSIRNFPAIGWFPALFDQLRSEQRHIPPVQHSFCSEEAPQEAHTRFPQKLGDCETRAHSQFTQRRHFNHETHPPSLLSIAFGCSQVIQGARQPTAASPFSHTWVLVGLTEYVTAHRHQTSNKRKKTCRILQGPAHQDGAS
jgi:hypothetical protein